jgi:hypothetical protein
MEKSLSQIVEIPAWIRKFLNFMLIGGVSLFTGCSTTSVLEAANGGEDGCPKCHGSRGRQPGYYFVVPLSLALDAATLPFQLIVYSMYINHMRQFIDQDKKTGPEEMKKTNKPGGENDEGSPCVGGLE